MKKKSSPTRLNFSLFATGCAHRLLYAEIKDRGDSEFTAPLERGDKTLDSWRDCLPQLPEGLFYSGYSGVLLKFQNVPPHSDEPVGMAVESWVGSCFGVLNSPKECYIQVGNDFQKLNKGDWILFDDALTHSVQSQTEVLGISIQIGAKSVERATSQEF